MPAISASGGEGRRPKQINRSIMKRLQQIIALSCIFLIVNSCAVNPVTGKKELALISEKQEIAMGAQYNPSVISSFGVYEDEKIQAFIQKKGQQMARISHRPNLDYQFQVLDTDVVNAFAVPGGYVYFTRGILAHFNNEAEFAGVLGHEIGHVTARHSVKQYSNQMLGQVLFIGGMIASKEFRQYADIASTGMSLLFLKFGRDHESQSDELGVLYSTKIGYDSHHMANFFSTIHRISERSGQGIPTFLSTHPDPLDREKKVHQMSDEIQKTTGNARLKENRDQYLALIDGLVYGEDPKQGFVENNMFYHPELKFKFPVPDGWLTENTPIQFQMAPQSQKALIQLTLAQEKSLQEAANAFIQNYNLQLVDSKNTSLNGMKALVFTADQPPQQEGAPVIRIRGTLIEYNGLIYKMLGLAQQTDFNAHQSYFKQVMENFTVLNDPDKLNRKPERIQIKSVAKTGSLKQALTYHKIPSNRHEELAILNGMELSTTVQQGMKIKTIGK